MCRRDRLLNDALAAAISSKSTMCFKLGAVVAHKGRVVGTGTNCSLRSKYGREYHVSLHAEMAACLDAMSRTRNIRGMEVYVARVLKNGEMAIAKPCMMCLKRLIEYGVKRVCYSDGILYTVSKPTDLARQSFDSNVYIITDTQRKFPQLFLRDVELLRAELI